MQMQPSLKMFAKIRKICTLTLVIGLVLELGQVSGSPTSPAAIPTTSATWVEGSASEAATTTLTTTLASSNAPATITNDVGAMSSQTEESESELEDRGTTMTTMMAETEQARKSAAHLGSKSRADVMDQGWSSSSDRSSRVEDKIRIKNSEHYPKVDEATRKSVEEAPQQQTTDEQQTATTITSLEQGNDGPKMHADVALSGTDARSTKTTLLDTTTATMQNSEVHVEENPENGLRRIKLPEIVTDELSSVPEAAESVAADEGVLRIMETQPTPYQVQENVGNHEGNENMRDAAAGKLNIVDLYPAKVEDFNPIIRDSNAKLLKERTVFTRIADEAEHRQNLLPNEVELQREYATFATKPRTVNRLPSATHRDSISDFTGKLLAEQDGVITEIEQKFRLNEFVTTTTAASSSTAGDTTTPASQTSTATLSGTPTWQRAQLSLSVNRRIYSGSGHDFIDRRVKKSFEFPMHRAASDVMSMPHIDFANTNFNTDTSGNPLGSGSGTAAKPAANMATAAHPEFSTTKFYNSKELYNEMLQHNRQKLRTAIDSPLASTSPTTTTTAPSKFATLLKTLKYKKYSNGELGSLAELTTAAATTAPIKRVTLTPAKTSTVAALPAASSTAAESGTQLSSAATLKPKKFEKELKRAKIVLKALLPTSDPRTQATQTTRTTETTKTTKTNSSQSIVTLAATAAGGTTLSSAAPSIPVGAVNTPQAVATASYSSADTTSSSPTTSATTKTRSTPTAADATTAAEATSAPPSSQRRVTNPTKSASKPIARPRILSRLQEKINSLECEIQNVPQDSHLWRGNETHELLLPIATPENCTNEPHNCPSPNVSWDGEAEIQSGDILIVEINDSLLHTKDDNHTNSAHSTQVYQVTRSGHEHCDVTEGILLDITPLVVDGRKLVTLYDKDLTEGVNLLIVVSELWGAQCVRLRVTTKTDNCGENADCSGKGVCYSNPAMEEYECQCCSGFAGPHCEEIDACTPSPCTNNGICVDLSQGHEGNSYQCLCPYGYTGKNCQYESDPCNPADCMNGGSCVGNSTHFRCDCTSGYAGPLCQHSLNECESSPCVHGICVDQEDGFRCFCQPGFAGELCNFEYNECESNPCQSGGECIDHIGSFECRCTKGYMGNRCQIKVDFCANKPCPEGHRCIDHGNDFSCECPGGRNGPDCNQMPRTQCNVNPCTHGGTCWSSGDSFYCACRPGYTGTMCEDEFVVETVVSSSEFMVDDTSARNFNDKTFGSSVVLKSPIELHNAYFAAGVLAAAIFIVAIVVTICHCKVNQTYRKFSSRSTTFFPILGFGRRPKSQNKLNKHWLSGKGLSSGNPLRSSSSSMASSRGHLPATNGNQYTTTGSAALHSQQQQQQQHQQQMGQLHERPFQRHLAMNLENDMYYTVDFSENSQHSPLIQ